MNRPKIKIKLDFFDKIFEGIGILRILLQIGLPLLYYGDLPDIIPRHYGLNGEPNGFSKKSIIWSLPIIGVIMHIGMRTLNKYPHIFNYPTVITKENVERLYQIASKMIRVLNTVITCVFAYLIFATIQIALRKQSGLGNYFTTIFMTSIFGTIAYFLRKMMRKK